MTADDTLFEPIFRLAAPAAETGRGRFLGEGLVLPTKYDLKDVNRKDPNFAALLNQSDAWIRRVLQPRWVPDGAVESLHAAPGGLGGEDAFVGAWEVRGRLFQVAVTRERVHIVTRLKTPCAPGASDDQRAKAARALAAEVLVWPAKLGEVNWIVDNFGGATLAFFDVDFARDWSETLVLLCDGRGIKLSAFKYLDRESPKERRTVAQSPVPWFPRKAKKPD